MASLFIRSALMGTLAGLAGAAAAGGLSWAALHGHDLAFAGGCALLILFSACLSPWGLILAGGCGILGVVFRPVSNRLPSEVSAVPLYIGLCLVVWIGPMLWHRTVTTVARTPEEIRERGGKPEILFPAWIALAGLAGALASGAGLARRPRVVEPRDSAVTLRPSVRWLVLVSGLLLFFGAFLILWGLAPVYQRRFDT